MASPPQNILGPFSNHLSPQVLQVNSVKPFIPKVEDINNEEMGPGEDITHQSDGAEHDRMGSTRSYEARS